MNDLQKAVEILQSNVSSLKEKVKKIEAREPRNERQAAQIEKTASKLKYVIAQIESSKVPNKPFATQKCAESIIAHNEFVNKGRDTWSADNVMSYAINLFEGRF